MMKSLKEMKSYQNIISKKGFGKKHMMIPDTQVKKGVPINHLKSIGNYAVEKRPDVITLIGDFADMPSLSSWDKGKKAFEGRRYREDIDSTLKALDALMNPIAKARNYNPRIVITLGNHEDRINRAVEERAEFDGVISIDDLQYEKYGIEQIPYKQPINIDGIHYCHYFYNPMTGRPYSGTAKSIISKVKSSFMMGHQQRLEIGCDPKIDGGMHWGVIAGCCYQHDEEYLGAQGNNNWRGIVMAHDVKDGNMDLMTVSLKYLLDRY
jgi:hypothetical protein